MEKAGGDQIVESSGHHMGLLKATRTTTTNKVNHYARLFGVMLLLELVWTSLARCGSKHRDYGTSSSGTLSFIMSLESDSRVICLCALACQGLVISHAHTHI